MKLEKDGVMLEFPEGFGNTPEEMIWAEEQLQQRLAPVPPIQLKNYQEYVVVSLACLAFAEKLGKESPGSHAHQEAERVAKFVTNTIQS